MLFTRLQVVTTCSMHDGVHTILQRRNEIQMACQKYGLHNLLWARLLNVEMQQISHISTL